MLTVLLGGARSGKSTLALRLASDSGDDVCFVATSPHIDGDDDLDQRIAAHRAERPSAWSTIEETTELAPAIRSTGAATVVVDCLTVWVGNLMYRGDDDRTIHAAAADALDAALDHDGHVIVVTNEVGLGIVPDNAEARRYRDVLGRVNQSWVAAADRARFLVAGRSFDLHEVAL